MLQNNGMGAQIMSTQIKTKGDGVIHGKVTNAINFKYRQIDSLKLLQINRCRTSNLATCTIGYLQTDHLHVYLISSFVKIRIVLVFE